MIELIIYFFIVKNDSLKNQRLFLAIMVYTVTVKHEYAVGGLADIKKGVDVSKIFDLGEAKLLFQKPKSGSSLILVPNIIGVYRAVIIALNPNGEGEPLERRIGPDENSFDTHPSLVQIGYDPDVLNNDIISNYIGPESSRMRIIPYEEIRTESEELRELSELVAQRIESIGEQPSSEEMQLLIRLAKQMLDTEGLTKAEWEILQKI